MAITISSSQLLAATPTAIFFKASKTPDEFISRDLMEKIVFEDEDIEVYFHQGDVDILAISFSDERAKPAQATWNGEALRRDGLSYLGFISKRPNWFPEASVKTAHKKLAHITNSFKTIVTFGQSQGGYAAIKYSSLFDACASISFCPQFSINPESMQGADKRFSAYYKNTTNHIEIVNTDQSNECISFIFFDPYDKLDKLNTLQIETTLPNTKTIKMFGTGHQCAHAITQNKTMGDIVRYSVIGDLTGIYRTVRQSKKRWPPRKIFLARDLALRNADYAINLINQSQTGLSHDITPGLVRNLYIGGGYKYLSENIERFLPYSNPSIRVLLLRALIASDKLDLAKKYNCEWQKKYGHDKSLHTLINNINISTTTKTKEATPFSECIIFAEGWHEEKSWGRWSSAERARIYIKSRFLTGKIRSITVPISTLSRAKQKITVNYLVNNRWVSARVSKGLLKINNCGASTIIDIHVSNLYSAHTLKINSDNHLVGARVLCQSKWIIDHGFGSTIIARAARLLARIFTRVGTPTRK